MEHLYFQITSKVAQVMMERKMVLISVIMCFCALPIAFANLSTEYNHAAYLDPDENYKLYWSVKHADKSIHFAAEVKTTGWVGFGISVGLTGRMKDADIVIGWVDSKGKPYLEVIFLLRMDWLPNYLFFRFFVDLPQVYGS